MSKEDEDLGFKYYQNTSDTLIVWFGGINEPYISSKLADETGFNVLAVRDHKFSWYTKGIIPGHASIEDGRSWLSSFIEDKKIIKTAFCGQSSGGYGALLYSFHCHANCCVTFSPQTRNLFTGQCTMVPGVKIVDVGELYKNTKHTKLIFNIGRSESSHEHEFFWDDWRQVEKFKMHDSATFITHPIDNHSISIVLRNDGILYKFVHNLLRIYL
ncbi:hypothetical protein ACE101_04825 [Methylobacterium sp. ID0610]